VRLFVAVWPSPEVVEAVRAFPRPEVPGLRWTTEDQWHVTLRFLGDVAADLVDPLVAALPAGGVDVVLGPATARLGRSILVAPVAGLDDVAAAVLRATAPLVPVVEDRPFRGHLTLARARRAPVPRSLVGLPLAGRWRAARVTLVRSTTAPSGARYEVVGEGA
jgi:2'-5' RNA ligase